jgi:hypothetical protein
MRTARAREARILASVVPAGHDPIQTLLWSGSTRRSSADRVYWSHQEQD